jgi:glycerol uptake facilitator-like aquaporin
VSATLPRQLAAEALGTGLLLAAIVGSGIMGERLAGGNAAVALLANSLATGCALAVLIAVLAPVSGAHFNPLVTLSLAARGAFPRSLALPYVAVQIVSAVAGVALAHAMFGTSLFAFSVKARSGMAQAVSELVAAFGLVMVVWACARRPRLPAPALVAAYIVAAYWFTASTSFANPAVTLARCLTDSFAGIRPVDVPLFVAAQAAGAVAATALAGWLFGTAGGRRPA